MHPLGRDFAHPCEENWTGKHIVLHNLQGTFSGTDYGTRFSSVGGISEKK